MSTSKEAVEDAVDTPVDYPSHFTEDFVAYCKANSITAGDFAAGATIPRYFYVTPNFVAQHSCDTPVDDAVLLEVVRRSAEAEGLKTEPGGVSFDFVPWLPSPWYVKGPSHATEFRVAPWKLHHSGALVGMDAASVLSVVALAPAPGESILDLCCAPGMKLGIIADAVRWRHGKEGEHNVARGGVAVGVDISMDRLFVARSCLKRRHAQGAVLVRADGRRFDPSGVDVESYWKTAEKNWNRKLLRTSNESILVFASHDTRDVTSLPQPFDRVLVDAECTHDGSMAHVVGHAATKPGGGDAPRKLHRMEVNTVSTEFVTSEALGATDELLQLQFDLLQRAFDLVKDDGVVVYSTCSFAAAQNEHIVCRFLKCNPRAVLVHPFHEARDAVPPMLRCSDSHVAAIEAMAERRDPQRLMFRFAPKLAATSFQFVAKIKKGSPPAP